MRATSGLDLMPTGPRSLDQARLKARKPTQTSGDHHGPRRGRQVGPPEEHPNDAPADEAEHDGPRQLPVHGERDQHRDRKGEVDAVAEAIRLGEFAEGSWAGEGGHRAEPIATLRGPQPRPPAEDRPAGGRKIPAAGLDAVEELGDRPRGERILGGFEHHRGRPVPKRTSKPVVDRDGEALLVARSGSPRSAGPPAPGLGHPRDRRAGRCRGSTRAPSPRDRGTGAMLEGDRHRAGIDLAQRVVGQVGLKSSIITPRASRGSTVTPSQGEVGTPRSPPVPGPGRARSDHRAGAAARRWRPPGSIGARGSRSRPGRRAAVGSPVPRGRDDRSGGRRAGGRQALDALAASRSTRLRQSFRRCAARCRR